MGLMLLEAGNEIGKINDGDSLEADAAQGLITNLTTGAAIRCPPLPPSMQELLQKGGLVPYVRERIA
ncbi:MAG: 3-isopropylmalate dehydratase small subunit, partial [Deltaproteobacteria bacterium]|jgi:3-isopropylmalate/(R)-2-methylmalate dehydratase small subunit|nr:3-isopropylmalate dehydratase small subunit [Deltaproteobacteria bacterium]